MNQSLSRFWGASFKHAFSVALAVVGLVAAQVVAEARSTAFSRIIVLGDSLSDTGNFHALTGGFPAAPYYNGRFSNGPLWVEYLAGGLEMEIATGDNYAVAGATTGHLNGNSTAQFTFPGLQHELAELLADHPGGLDPDALYVLWAGANDFFVAFATQQPFSVMIAEGVSNLGSTVQQLAAAGARHIMVVNIPDLGLTPFGLSVNSAGLTAASDAYNDGLALVLGALNQAGISTIQVDAFATLQAMVNDPAEYGFANVTHPYLLVPVGDPATYLFWDPVHPTTGGHEVLAEAALSALIDHYSPSNGKASPAARINALKGLVKKAR